MTPDNEKTTREKLAVLLPHLVSHNAEHAGELEKWAERAEHEGDASVCEELRHAARHMKKSGERLNVAFSLLTGEKPAEHVHDLGTSGCCGDADAHHHHHDHHEGHDHHHDHDHHHGHHHHKEN